MSAPTSVFERVLAVLDDMPSVGKTARNQQQNFDYRSHDDVLNNLNPLLSKHGVFMVPNVIERIPGQRTTKQGYTMYEVNLHVAYTFYGPAGDEFKASAWGEGTDSGDKATNKAMTMAFKNVIAQVFALATGEPDPDGGTPEPTTREKTSQFAAPSVKAPTKAQVKAVIDTGTVLVENHGVDPLALQNFAKSALPWPDFVAGMDPEQFKDFAGKLERRLANAISEAA